VKNTVSQEATAPAPVEQAVREPVAAPALVVREEEDPWTPAELAAVREELTAELDRIGLDMAALQFSIADVLRDSGDGAGDDQADTGSKAFEREQEMTLLANARESRFQTQRAVQAIEDGTYGRCESCGNPIGKARLQAFPRATLCVSCKQMQERR
jgi:DnaK suppressor protein